MSLSLYLRTALADVFTNIDLCRSLNKYSPVQIRYDDGTQKLHVTVVKCEALPKKDLLGGSDPFVRVYLMPGTHTELKTMIVKNSASPVYNDEFSFKVRTRSHNSHHTSNIHLSSSLLMMFRRKRLSSKCSNIPSPSLTGSSMTMTRSERPRSLSGHLTQTSARRRRK